MNADNDYFPHKVRWYDGTMVWWQCWWSKTWQCPRWPLLRPATARYLNGKMSINIDINILLQWQCQLYFYISDHFWWFSNSLRVQGLPKPELYRRILKPRELLWNAPCPLHSRKCPWNWLAWWRWLVHFDSSMTTSGLRQTCDNEKWWQQPPVYDNSPGFHFSPWIWGLF